MSSEPRPIMGSLAAMIRSAAEGEIPDGWLYLPEGEIKTDTQCALLIGVDIENLEAKGASLGFPVCGLDTAYLRVIYESAGDSCGSTPSDHDLVRAYVDQLKFDAEANSHFYESLGQERPEVACRCTGCERGAIALSVFL